MLQRFTRAVLVLMPVTTCAARLHAHSIEPLDATQELTRCARLVRVVVGRRRTDGDSGANLAATTSVQPDPERPGR
jgi:hypothetical protein